VSVSSRELQTVFLKVLADPRFHDHRLGRGEFHTARAVADRFPSSRSITQQQIMEAMWSLIAQGLAYIDNMQRSREHWELKLTETGLAAARDEQINPDSSGEYLHRLRTMVSDASPTVLTYAEESLRAFSSRCYLASAVMLGVASEAAFLEMALAFGDWLPEAQREKFAKIIEDLRRNYTDKFREFRKRVEPRKPELPGELSDGMSLWLDSVLDLLRIYRNDAGHPTGKQITHDDAFINLQIFAPYLRKLYALRTFFQTNLDSGVV
jgi:hypothetical protein